MGFLFNVREETDVARLAPTTRLIPRTVDHEDLDVLDARHGRTRAGSAPFLVVFMVPDTVAGVTSAFRYRQGTDTWADATTTNCPVGEVERAIGQKPAVLIGGSLFFRTLETEGRILRYDLLAERLSLIKPASMAQVPCRDYKLLPGADGRLLLAKVQLSTLLLWETVVPPNRTRYSGTYAVGFSEVHQVLYFTTGKEFHSVQLKSRRISDRIFISGSLDNTVVPFVSFVTAGMLIFAGLANLRVANDQFNIVMGIRDLRY
ncbi:hypothetical protein GQ55_9G609800 [Panicum hallii var. hallii]|uniref:Uncharacterized protein n=1 Tax=Panicum hallii var. hallii TaxID=1504633 RepID=A0A2T7CHF3_9POAL|nr:hypothetical protein GQ55_9G609800 [Panicum hallii var. hallii]